MERQLLANILDRIEALSKKIDDYIGAHGQSHEALIREVATQKARLEVLEKSACEVVVLREQVSKNRVALARIYAWAAGAGAMTAGIFQAVPLLVKYLRG